MRINTEHRVVYHYASFLHGQPASRLKRRKIRTPLAGSICTVLFTIVMSLCCRENLSRFLGPYVVSSRLPVSKPAMQCQVKRRLIYQCLRTFCFLFIKFISASPICPVTRFHPDVGWLSCLALFLRSCPLTFLLNLFLPPSPHITPLLFFA